MFELRKIGIVRRASAWLLDAILLAVLTTGIMWIVSLICNYSYEEQLAIGYYNEWEDFRKENLGTLASYYGFTYTTQDDGTYTVEKDGVAKSIDDVIAALVNSGGNDEETAELYRLYQELPAPNVVNEQYFKVHTLLFMMVSVGLLLSYLILEFVLPLILKNGQTVGKKVFGVGLVRPNCVRVTAVSMFTRSVLGKFAIETMFPVLLVFLFLYSRLGLLAVILFAALMLLNIVLFFATKNHTPIHDILAYTVAVDLRLQMVFDSDEELLEKKKAEHQAKAEGSDPQ